MGKSAGEGSPAAMLVEEIARKFNVPGRLAFIRQHGSGNVNDTYLAVFRTAFSEQRFILQRIRKLIFPEPEAIMRNMRVITDHCHRKIEAVADDADRIWQLPKIIETHEGTDFVMDENGDLWRAITQIAGASTHEKVRNVEHAREAGYVLGHFQKMISDIPIEKLAYALPGFHVTPGYLAKMDAALATDMGQARMASPDARRCLKFIQERRELCHVLRNALDAGELKLRPTHGDPKVGNIMIDDETGLGTSMIDLDTVQPGLIHYDLGDCLRSGCNPEGEDAEDLQSVVFDTDLFAAIFKGYMTHAGDFLTEGDRKHLFNAINLIPLELAVRFFADYLAGDVYFKTRYPGHNLRRAIVQMRLTESIETREPIIREVMERSLSKRSWKK